MRLDRVPVSFVSCEMRLMGICAVFFSRVGYVNSVSSSGVEHAGTIAARGGVEQVKRSDMTQTPESFGCLARKRSRSDEFCGLSEGKEEEEAKIRRKSKSASADPESISDTDL